MRMVLVYISNSLFACWVHDECMQEAAQQGATLLLHSCPIYGQAANLPVSHKPAFPYPEHPQRHAGSLLLCSHLL